MTEKFEILKKDAKTGRDETFVYTGTIIEDKDGWVRILTTRGEKLRFRKEQIQYAQEVQDTTRDNNGQSSNYN